MKVTQVQSLACDSWDQSQVLAPSTVRWDPAIPSVPQKGITLDDLSWMKAFPPQLYILIHLPESPCLTLSIMCCPQVESPVICKILDTADENGLLSLPSWRAATVRRRDRSHSDFSDWSTYRDHNRTLSWLWIICVYKRLLINFYCRHFSQLLFWLLYLMNWLCVFHCLDNVISK